MGREFETQNSTSVGMNPKVSSIESKFGIQNLTLYDTKLKDQVETELKKLSSPTQDDLSIIDETYRLFGISSFMMNKKQLTCIRFDTCYLGRYFEIYYVFMKVGSVADSTPTIVAHTLPSFMPVDIWEKEFLSRDVQTFTQCVSININSFISRREQCRLLEKSFRNKIEVISSDSYCRIELCFEDFCIKLSYNMDARLPYNVEQTISQQELPFLREQKNNIGFAHNEIQRFYNLPIVEAIASIWQL